MSHCLISLFFLLSQTAFLIQLKFNLFFSCCSWNDYGLERHIQTRVVVNCCHGLIVQGQSNQFIGHLHLTSRIFKSALLETQAFWYEGSYRESHLGKNSGITFLFSLCFMLVYLCHLHILKMVFFVLFFNLLKGHTSVFLVPLSTVYS